MGQIFSLNWQDRGLRLLFRVCTSRGQQRLQARRAVG